MIDPKLFDPDPGVRWKTAREFRQNNYLAIKSKIESDFRDWPNFWWGGVNPWVVFVGPSPGNRPGQPIDWKKEKMPTLGEANTIVKTYEDKNGFWSRMRNWSIAAFELAEVFRGEPEAALGSILIANIIPCNQGNSSKIKDADLSAATPKAVKLISRLRPRLIVPMEKRVSRLLITEFENQGSYIQKGPIKYKMPAKNQRYDYYKPTIWELQTSFGTLCIAESPQHPTKQKFYEPSIVDEYLASIIVRCLPA